MGLLDKLHGIHAEPADRDLLDYFGIRPDRLIITREKLTVGDETVPLAEARAAMAGPPIRQTPTPRRTVVIGDL